METLIKKKASATNNFVHGAMWETTNPFGKIVKIVDKEWDKFNIRLTSGQIFSKRMLNKNYKFVGMVDFSKNKKTVVKRYKQMASGDCIVYITDCKCGEKVSGWSEKEADDNWNIHFCQ